MLLLVVFVKKGCNNGQCLSREGEVLLKPVPMLHYRAPSTSFLHCAQEIVDGKGFFNVGSDIELGHVFSANRS